MGLPSKMSAVLIRRNQDTDTQRDERVKTWEEDGHLCARQRARRTQACGHLDLGLPTSGVGTNKCLPFKPH